MSTYEQSRSEIQSGDLLAWSHRKWGSWYDFQVQMVRLFTQSEYCHVGTAWSIGGRVFVLEAVGAGVRLFPLSHLVPFYHLPTSNQWPWNIKAEKFALAQLGKSYSKWQAVAAFLGVLKDGSDDKWECAEYAKAILGKCGLELTCNSTPTAIVQAVMEKGVPVRYIM